MISRISTSIALGMFTLALASPAQATEGTVLIPPAYAVGQTCSFTNSSVPANTTMLSPIPSAASYALGGSAGGASLPSTPVKLILVGSAWTQNGTPTGALTPNAQKVLDHVQTMVNSPYFSGLTQYGSSGSISFDEATDYWVDTCEDPVSLHKNGTVIYWLEAYRSTLANTGDACTNSQHAAWAASVGHPNAGNSAVFVEVDYSAGANGSNSGAGGQNDFSGPDSNGTPHCENGSCGNTGKLYNANAAGCGVGYANDSSTPGLLSWCISHELDERMSTGIAAQQSQCSPAGQICDGQPENGPGMNASIINLDNGDSAPVQTYWSVMDQAYIAPGATLPNGDGDVDARMLVTVAASNQGAVSLRKGVLSAFQPLSDGATVSGGPIDTQVQAYALDVNDTLYDLTSGGQVKWFDQAGNGYSNGAWTAITGSSTHATRLVAPSAPNPCKGGRVGGGLYMLASNAPGPAQVWEYDGYLTAWTALTGTNTSVQELTSVSRYQCESGSPVGGSTLYMIASNPNQPTYVWAYGGSGQNWSPVTPSYLSPIEIVSANDSLYMLAINNEDGTSWVWQYTGSGTGWNYINPTSWYVDQLYVSGTQLVAVTSDGRLRAYVPPSATGGAPGGASNWTAITGSNTSYATSRVQDGIELFLDGNNGSGNQVFEFQGAWSPSFSDWTVLSDPSAQDPLSIGISSADTLEMYDGDSNQILYYFGSPFFWFPAITPPDCPTYYWTCTGTYGTTTDAYFQCNPPDGTLTLQRYVDGTWEQENPSFYTNPSTGDVSINALGDPGGAMATYRVCVSNSLGQSACSADMTMSTGACTCTPVTCASTQTVCGALSDGCGGTLECGTCKLGTCSAGQCVTGGGGGRCKPGTCS